jgi:predicted nuclease of predicted toxin-antitoxin system
MKFKIDENLPLDVAELLIEVGHDAHTVYDEDLSGARDEIIARKVKREKRILVTIDLDFSDIRTYPPAFYYGIIVLRLSRQDKNTILSAVQTFLSVLEHEPIEAKLWIVEDKKIRIRE